LGLALASSAGAAETDAFLGTWVLDPALSRYEAGAVPASMVIVMGDAEDGLRYQSCSVFAAGRPAYAEYTARYDGRPVMVTGNAGVMVPVSLRQTAAATVVATYARAFQVIATSERRLENQGATMIITTATRQPDGAALVNVGVYRRQAETAALALESCRQMPTGVPAR
jgi:hypothetical protein